MASSTPAAAQAAIQQFIAAVSGPAIPTHAPTQLTTFRAQLDSLLVRLQAYHWSAQFNIQAKRIYHTGTHDLHAAVTSFVVDDAAIEPARAFAWTQFAALMDWYVNAERGTMATGTWMEGLRVWEYDTDVSNDQLETLVVCSLAVKEDVDAVCEAVVVEGGREWWVVPSPVAHFGACSVPSRFALAFDTADG